MFLGVYSNFAGIFQSTDFNRFSKLLFSPAPSHRTIVTGFPFFPHSWKISAVGSTMELLASNHRANPHPEYSSTNILKLGLATYGVAFLSFGSLIDLMSRKIRFPGPSALTCLLSLATFFCFPFPFAQDSQFFNIPLVRFHLRCFAVALAASSFECPNKSCAC